MDHKSCIRCDHFIRCQDPRKTITFYCDRYKVTKQSMAQEKALLEDFFDAPFRTSTLSLESDSPIALPGEANAGMFDVKAALEEMMAEKRMVSPDLKIPEGDFPEAPNFYTWCIGENFLNQKPFAMQALIATQLFAEYCVAKGSLVITESGIRRIEDLCRTDKVGMSRNRTRIATSTGIEYTSQAGMTSKSRKCLELRTIRGGRSVIATPEHRVLVMRSGELQWVQARNVVPGDYLTARIGQDLWPAESVPLTEVSVAVQGSDGRSISSYVQKVPSTTSAKLARFVGYLLSDGTIDKYKIAFINTCKPLRDDFVKCGQDLFGITFKTKKYIPTAGTKVCYTASHASASTSSVMADIGIKIATSYTKEIPDFILQAPRAEVVEFIRAVFDCDGYMQKGRVGIVMSSKHIVSGLSVLLDNLGIYHICEEVKIDSKNHPNIKNKKNRGSKDLHHKIEIRDVRKFCEVIGTLNTQRTKVLNWNLQNSRNSEDRGSRTAANIKPGSIPNFDLFVDRLLAAKTEYHGLSISKALSGTQRASTVVLDKVLTEELFNYCVKYDCLDVYNDLSELKECNFAYYEVESVVDAGYHPVYDVSVPGSESFMCNGVIVHNCPLCSDMEYMEHNIKVGDSLEKFGRKVALLEHGKCPHCGASKLKLFKKGLLAPYWELALVAGQRCVSADTLVLTQDGVVEIGDYAANRPYGFSPFHVGMHTGSGMQTSSQFYRARPEVCRRIRTKLGFSIVGTDDHPVMAHSGFKRAATIQEGDYLRVYYGQRLFGNKTVVLKDVTERTNAQWHQWHAGLTPMAKANAVRPRRKPGFGKRNLYVLNEDLASVLGYWVSEGRSRSISNTDPEILGKCYGVLARMFGSNAVRLARNCVEFSNTYVQMWLANLMQIDVHAGSAGKEIPRCILQASKPVQKAFLASLFEGDGYVNHGKKTYSVGYTTISRKLSDQLSVVLLNLGIPHKRRARNTWATNGSAKQVAKTGYGITISGPAMSVFAEMIGFDSQRKRESLADAVAWCSGRTNRVPLYYEKLPRPLHDTFHDVLSEVKRQLNQLETADKAHAYGLQSVFGKGHRSFTRSDRSRTATKQDILLYIEPLTSERFLFDHATSAKIQSLVEYAYGNYFYDVVVSNRQTKPIETFDVTIPGAHRFISNGLLSHNSGKSAVLGMMGSYLTHRMIKLGRPNEVLGLLKSNVLHGTFVALTFQQAQQTLYEPYYGNILDSPWFCIAEGTEVSLADGSYVPIQDIQVGTEVKTLEGTDTVTQVFDNGVHACNEVILHDGSALLGTDDHLVRCLSDDGMGLVWKRIADLTDEDFVVVDAEDCDDN